MMVQEQTVLMILTYALPNISMTDLIKNVLQTQLNALMDGWET